VTFLLSEDAALKAKLQGITVTDQTAGAAETPRQVGVWFGQPDQEIRAQSYPYITIQLIDVSRDMEREMKGIVSPDYLAPEDFNQDTSSFEIDYPIPVNIEYQVTTFSRHPRHDRQILASLMYNKLFLRNNVLETDDGTVRRLDILDVAKRDTVENQRRLFVNAFTVRVSSEIAQKQLLEFTKVTNIDISQFVVLGKSVTRPTTPEPEEEDPSEEEPPSEEN
jgi:hypothetical protein